MKLRLVFLDDERNPNVAPHSSMITALLTNDLTEEVYPAEIVWVRNYNQFVREIRENGLPDILSLDHDLDFKTMIGEPSEEKTGYDCAHWLVEYCMREGVDLPPITQCHSQNPAGKQNIVTLLSNFRKYRPILWK